MSEQVGQEGTTPDYIPGWFAPRVGNADPALREAVRIPEREDFFPITFLHWTETVRPVQRPQRGFAIGKVSEPGHDLFDLVVPPGYWIVRDADGALHNWRDEDFKAKYSRSDRYWRPPVERDVPSGRPAAAERHRHGAEDLTRAGHRIDTAKVIPRAGEEAPDGWQGTPPAKGTRRHLILGTIRGFADDLISDVDLADADTLLELADRVEAALLQSALDDEARSRLAEALTDGIVEVDPGANRTGRSVAGEEAAKALHHLILARCETVDPAELARINEAITAAHMVVEPPSYTATAEAVDREVGEEPPADDAAGGDDLGTKIKYYESAIERLLGHREEARTREGRFAEERDCAYALLRWLLPVTVAKRLD